ncbi:hypothetical protein PtB15_8B123 [Puccinia triticina]|nr:hypothetical protein PtB15_8B123 [Puccinia triticina]
MLINILIRAIPFSKSKTPRWLTQTDHQGLAPPTPPQKSPPPPMPSLIMANIDQIFSTHGPSPNFRRHISHFIITPGQHSTKRVHPFKATLYSRLPGLNTAQSISSSGTFERIQTLDEHHPLQQPRGPQRKELPFRLPSSLVCRSSSC